MAPIDFTKKGLNQVIFAKKTFKSAAGKNSSAFKAIMENKNIAKVVDKFGEKKVFYDALKKRAMSSSKYGITKNDFKKVLGDIEHSGKFSHHEMMDLRKNLVGGPMSSNIIREHSSSMPQHENRMPSKPEVNMRKVYQEIMDKSPYKKTTSQNASNVQNSQANFSAPITMNFRSNANIREAEGGNLIKKAEKVDTHPFYDHQRMKEGDEELKAKLKELQSGE